MMVSSKYFPKNSIRYRGKFLLKFAYVERQISGCVVKEDKVRDRKKCLSK